VKILITVDPEIPVPPVLYGGIERVVSSLIKAFNQKGHEVHLLANANSSETAAKSITGWRGKSSVSKSDILKNAAQLNQLYKKLKPDLVHSFSRLLYLYPLFWGKEAKIVMSYQREISPKTTAVASLLGGNRLIFTSCGAHTFKNLPNKEKWHAIHNFADTNFLVDNQNVEKEFLFFLGRIEDIKGTAEAIEVARSSGERLIIAGNISPEHQAYFDNKVKPFLNDNIQYVGAVNDEQKKYYFQRSKAFLFPIKWEEPFGIVMAESMACGCPVIGFNRGSVPEVIEHGKNGYIVENVQEMTDAVKKISQIKRSEVRECAVKNFSIEVISEKYLQVYQKLLSKEK